MKTKTPKDTLQFQGWESITDVPCTILGCCGVIRWAEAGYVPGYRICDGTTRHHFELRDNVLVPNGRTERGYRTRVDRAKALAAATASAINFDRQYGIDRARHDRTTLGISIGGSRVDRSGPYWVEEMRRLEPEMWALAEQIMAALPDCSSLIDVFRDGTCHIYREKNKRGLFGGTCVLSVAAVLSRPQPEYAKFYCSEDFEAACGGAVSGYKTATGYMPDGTIAPPLMEQVAK